MQTGDMSRSEVNKSPGISNTFQPWGVGVLHIFLGGEVRTGPLNPDPVKDKNCPIFDTLCKNLSLKLLFIFFTYFLFATHLLYPL